MSRIGRLPITVPAGVTVTVDADNLVTVKGPKGTLSQQVNSAITVKQEGNVLTLERPTDSKPHKAMHGLYRALVHNMVVGVTDGFTNLFGTEYACVNVERLEIFNDGDVVTAQSLLDAGIIRKTLDGVKIMGNGELTKKLTVQASKFTASAKEKIEALGGKAEVI